MTAVYVEPDYDASQRREIALMYSSLGRGEKGAYAKKVGVPTHRIRRWISALVKRQVFLAVLRQVFCKGWALF